MTSANKRQKLTDGSHVSLDEYPKLLGRGTFGRVVDEGDKRATKIMSMFQEDTGIVDDNNAREVILHALLLRSPRFIPVEAIEIDDAELESRIKMPIANMDLLKWVALNPDRAERIQHVYEWIADDLIEAVDDLHRHGLIHGDIKPQNVLMVMESGEMQVRLGDFGSCSVFENADPERCTYLFRPSEGFDKKFPPSKDYDVTLFDSWSVGWTLVYLITGKYAHGFCDLKMSKRMHKIGRVSESIEEFANAQDVPQKLKARILGLISADYRTRTPLRDALGVGSRKLDIDDYTKMTSECHDDKIYVMCIKKGASKEVMRCASWILRESSKSTTFKEDDLRVYIILAECIVCRDLHFACTAEAIGLKKGILNVLKSLGHGFLSKV